VVHAFARVTLLEFGEVEAGAEVFTFAINDSGPGRFGQVLEGVADRFDQCV